MDEPEYVSENVIIEKDVIADGVDVNIIGYLTIESIGLMNAPIAEGTSMEVLNQYIGHFEETPIFNGNVAFCGHNRGYDNNYFANLKNVKEGDLIFYEMKNNQYTYKVTSINIIQETDLEVLDHSNNNKLTLITCVENRPNERYCVIAEKI